MLVSRHFYAAATASRRLWRDVSVYGGGMTSLQRLTVRHGGLGIERLRWYVGSRPMSYSPFALRDQWELDQLWQSFRATALAASGSLRSLSLQHMPDELAEHCLPLLSHLSELEVDWRGTKPELRLANHGLGTFSELQASKTLIQPSARSCVSGFFFFRLVISPLRHCLWIPAHLQISKSPSPAQPYHLPPHPAEP